MTLNQRLIDIARIVADAHRRRAKVVEHDPIERQQYQRCMGASERVDRMADGWENVDNAARYIPLHFNGAIKLF